MARPVPLPDQVARFFEQTGIPSGSRVVAAVSGGIDSATLLDLLVKTGLEVVVAHLNHGLRGVDSDKDAAAAAGLAAAHDCRFHIRKVDVEGIADHERISVETAGRDARRQWLAEVAQREGTDLVCLAHHADDQAETVLWNLVRGCGLQGAGGMAPDDWQNIAGRRLRLLRPLLGARRAEIERYAWRHKLLWRDDLTNQELDYTRNRIRLEAIPALAEACDRDPVPGLVRFAEVARGDDHLLDGLAMGALSSLRGEGGTLEVREFRTWAMALQRRIVAIWLVASGVPRIGLREIDAVLKVACASARPARVQLAGGWRVRRTGVRLFLEKEAS